MFGRRTWGILWLCFVGVSILPVEASSSGPRVHVVRSGETLKKIADRYGVSLQALCRANDLDRRSKIQPDQKLLVPSPRARRGSASGDKTRTPPPRWQNARAVEGADGRDVRSDSWRRYLAAPTSPGEITLEGPGRSWQGRVDLTATQVPERVQEAFRRVLFSHRTGREADISPRLIRLLVQVSDAFGGRPLHVVSGYRESSEVAESRHKTGRACDFYVAGVPNEALVAYLHTLRHVGVGFYPNSTFVHLDVRAVTARWTDVSGPGEPARYVSHR